MAGESSEMDSLFEGMDFMMPLENDSQFVVDGGTKALEATKVAQEDSTKPSVPSAPASSRSSPSLGPVSLSSEPDVGFSSRSSSTVALPSQPPSRSLSPTPASPTTALGDQPRDHSEPLDESLFSGLTLAVVEDDPITEFNPESANGMLTNSTTIISKIESTEKISMDSINQDERSRSFDDPSGGASAGNAAKDGGSMENTMPVHNDGSPYLSPSGKYPPSGAVPTLTRTGSGFSSTVSPPVKPSMRRKKRSMKIGYGREDEENEELGSKKAGIRDAFGAALLGVKEGVNSSSSTSTPKYGLSRETSHNALSVEESTLAFGSPLGIDLSPSNGVELAKDNSSSRFSSGSQYSTLEVDGIERLESRDISREILLQLESEKPEVILQECDIPDIDERDLSSENGCDERDPSPDNGQPNGSPDEETKSDVEVGSEPPSTAGEETMPDIEVASESPRKDPEDTAPSIKMESAAPSQEHEGGEAEAIVQAKEDDDLGIQSLPQPKEGTIEERLGFIKEAVAHTLKALHEKMSAVSGLKKTAVQKRRHAAEKVTAALARCMELEAQLNAACEREDFEKADSVSGMIAVAETSMAQAGEAFAAAEAESDSAASKVQDVLDLQVAIEEQSATFLETLKQEAEEAAAKTLTEAQEIASRETERLEAEANAIEIRKKKLDLELNGVQEAREELNKAIGDLTQSERKERALLTEKRDQLGAELQDLLKLVRVKEAEIAECDECIAGVDDKISSVAANFENQKASLDVELETITLAALKLEKDSSVVSEGRQGIEHLLADAEEKRCKLEHSARSASDAGKAMHDTVKIKKSIAMSIMQSRKNRTELAEKEKQAQAESQLLRQNAASTRVLLQELTASKVKLGQELGAVKERIAFAEKRAPELDAEKKLAAAARNFKVAGRLAAEAKVLNGEKEAASVEMAKITKELEIVEREAELKLQTLADLDNLITAKEREGATAHCERLRLVAAAARDEQFVAVELDDFEEAESLDTEAKAADAEAEALQKLYQLVGSKFSSHDSRTSEDAVPMDREAAMAECERLRIVAASARAEMETASECDQFDEAETLHSNAEMADAEADRLQSLHQLEGRQFERQTIRNASEDLSSKDKELAMAECEKLRLLAAGARATRDTAVELDQFEEAEAFDSKAEAADTEADRLQKLFQLEGEQYRRQENLITKNQPE